MDIRFAPVALAACLFVVAGCMPATRGVSPEVAAKAWKADVAALAGGADNAARRAAVLERLRAIGLDAREMPFEAEGLRGINLISPVAGAADAPVLLIGAHYDRVEVGQGATDNGSGTAAVLALAERLRRAPLRHHRVVVAFWDLEERGLLGSSAYVAAGDRPALYVNFDVFGWGDTLWMMTPTADGPLVAASRDATRVAGLRLADGAQYPPTDHLPFLKAGWPAVSYSLVGGDEVPLILQMFSGQQPASMPKVMRVIHRADDTLEQVDAAAVARGLDAVEGAIRRWDAAAR